MGESTSCSASDSRLSHFQRPSDYVVQLMQLSAWYKFVDQCGQTSDVSHFKQIGKANERMSIIVETWCMHC